MFTGQKFKTFVMTPNQVDLLFLKGLVEAGKARPIIERSYPLGEAAEALRHVGEGHAPGQTVMLRDVHLLRRANKVTALIWRDGAGRKSTRSLEAVAHRARTLDKAPGAHAPTANAPRCGRTPPLAEAPPAEKALGDEEFLDQPIDPTRLPDPTPGDLSKEATSELERPRPVFTICTARGPVVVTTWHLWKLICDDPAPAPGRASKVQQAVDAMESALEKLADECREEPGRFFCSPKAPTPRGGIGTRG